MPHYILIGAVSNVMQWFPSLMLLIAIAISFFTAESAAYLPTLIFGTYMSWIYLRYFQRKPETKLRGDPSDDFAFSSFFPESLRYFLLYLQDTGFLAHGMYEFVYVLPSPTLYLLPGQSLILLHQYSIGCFVEDLKLLPKPMVKPWEMLHCLVLIPLRQLGGGKFIHPISNFG